MPCTPVNLGGVRAILCTRGPRPRCACGQPATLQCDAPAKRRSGTCDKHLCAACALEVGPDRHLCPGHQAELTARAHQIIALRIRHNASGQDGRDLQAIVEALASGFSTADEVARPVQEVLF